MTTKKSKVVTEVNDSPPKTQEEKPIEKAFSKARKEEAEKKKLTDPFEPPKKRKLDDLKLSDPLGLKNKGTITPILNKTKKEKQKECLDGTTAEDILKAMELLIDRVDTLQDYIERLHDMLLRVEPDE